MSRIFTLPIFTLQDETLSLLTPLSSSTNNSGAEPSWSNRVEGAGALLGAERSPLWPVPPFVFHVTRTVAGASHLRHAEAASASVAFQILAEASFGRAIL